VKLSVMLNYSGDVMAAADEAIELEQAGLDCVWVAEAYSFDAVSMMGYLAGRSSRLEIGSAIVNIYSRTPTLLAMTAAGLDVVSGGRVNLGIGASGPQVVEGFHGVPYEKPLARTKEVIDVCRRVWKREVIEHHGATIDIPLPEGQGTGLAKPLKLINTPVREAIPIWIASLRSKSVEATAELADGWIPSFYIPERANLVWGDALAAGKTKRDAKLGPLQTIAGGPVMFTDDPDLPATINDFGRGTVALYVGGMGARGQNFYNEIMSAYGWEAEAKLIQDLYLDGKKDQAAAAVPAELLAASSLVGPESYITDRVAAYAASGVTHLQLTLIGSLAQKRETLDKLRKIID
jgi:F420-dependent oxidoreductase-like protein